jgi:hypothetical protein
MQWFNRGLNCRPLELTSILSLDIHRWLPSFKIAILHSNFFDGDNLLTFSSSLGTLINKALDFYSNRSVGNPNLEYFPALKGTF